MNNKGGIKEESKGLLPLDEVIWKSLIVSMRAYFRGVILEKDAHASTLQLLQRIKRGEVDIANVMVTDDGWQVLGERPRPTDSAAPSRPADTSQLNVGAPLSVEGACSDGHQDAATIPGATS